MSHTKPTNPISPKKLLHSKWTAVNPANKERHFMVVKVTYDDHKNVEQCVIEAVLTEREMDINWRDLKNAEHWQTGWQ